MSDHKEDVIQQEVVSPTKPQKGGLKRHCARFWWIYAIILVIGAVLIVVIAIFAVVPKIAQKKLDQAVLTLDAVRISNTTPDSLTMALDSTITADDSVKATIEGFTGVMYLEDIASHSPFATLQFPETKTVKIQAVNISQTLNINDNREALTTFNNWLIANKTLKVTVEGKTKVHVKGLSKAYGVTFKKTLEINGLDNFSGLSVTDATISVLGDANGDNFKGFVNVPNHSVFTLEIGNATFDTFFNSSSVGVTHLDNMVLVPGNNNVTMHAQVKQAPILTANNKSPYCETGIFNFQFTGINVTNHDQNITYFGEALSHTTQNTDIPIGSYLQKDLNITAKCT